MKNTTILATENTTVKDITTLTVFVLKEHFEKHYNFSIDSDCIDDDYIHVLRNDTLIQSNKAHNHAFHMYYKHKKQQVNVLCNKANFDAFESVYRVADKKKMCKYVVDYAHIIDFMREIMTYDTNRATTSATKENAESIAQ